MLKGNDFLFLKHYIDEAIKAQRPGDVAGAFLTTAGDASVEVKRFIDKTNPVQFVLHLAKFDYLHKYPIKELMPSLRRQAQWCERMVNELDYGGLYISPFCENKHPAKTMQKVFDELREIAPSCEFVNSSMTLQEVKGVITEVHLTNSRPVKLPKGPFFVSMDGFGGEGDGDFCDTNPPAILDAVRNALHVRTWGFRHNGKYGDKDPATIAQRKHWPTVQYLRGYRSLLDDREYGPIRGATAVATGDQWPNNTLYKPFADDHGNGPESKDNKAMCILPTKIEKVRVYDIQGKLIDHLRYVGTHDGDPRGYRYYSSNYGFQLAAKAKKNTGSCLVKIESMPLIDPRFRSGRYK